MAEKEYLNSGVGRQSKPELNGTVKLGDVLNRLMEDRVSPQHDKLKLVIGFWDQLLPSELCQHCRIVDISGGRISVMVDSPLYKYELELCGSQILGQLQQHCPRAKIKGIRFTIG